MERSLRTEELICLAVSGSRTVGKGEGKDS